jgi:hypothetical protein
MEPESGPSMGGYERPQPVKATPEELPPFEDYFGFGEEEKWFLPDGTQYFVFKVMNEGEKAFFQKQTNRDVIVDKNSGDAKLKVDPAAERHTLIVTSVTGWYLFKNNKPVVFGKGTPGSMLEQWLAVANPKLVEDLELTIRKANPWMQADMKVEDIDKEIERLQDLRKNVVENDLKKSTSLSK